MARACPCVCVCVRNKVLHGALRPRAMERSGVRVSIAWGPGAWGLSRGRGSRSWLIETAVVGSAGCEPEGPPSTLLEQRSRYRRGATDRSWWEVAGGHWRGELAQSGHRTPAQKATERRYRYSIKSYCRDDRPRAKHYCKPWQAQRARRQCDLAGRTSSRDATRRPLRTRLRTQRHHCLQAVWWA